MSRHDARRAGIAIGHLEALRRHLGRGSLDDELVFDAVCQRLSASIEEVNGIDDTLLVRSTIANDLDAFEAGLRRIAQATEPGE